MSLFSIIRHFSSGVPGLLLTLAASAHLAHAQTPGAGPATSDGVLRIGFIIPRADAAASAMWLAGARLAADEAQRTTDLLGRNFELLTVYATGAALPDAVAGLADAGAFAIVGGFTGEDCGILNESAAEHRILFFNVGCTADALRGDQCRRTSFHLAPSDAMLEHARRAGGDPGVTVAAWHPTLFRYGARQVNDRFSAAAAQPMAADAWTGWLAVKILAEAALRGGSGDAERLVAYLERASTRFDGHKGMPLSFRSWDHQLRQPLYIVDSDRSAVLGSVPTDLPDVDAPVSDLLDQIGTGVEQTTCKFTATQ